MANTEEHPTFPRSPIIEAVCELHFSLPDATVWNSEWFGAMFAALHADYPKLEPRQVMEVDATIGGGGMQIGAPRVRMAFRHKERAHLLQLDSKLLAINQKSPYPGWTQFAADIRSAWEVLIGIAGPLSITRAGLRYINVIARQSPGESLEDWLSPEGGYYPSIVAQTPDLFVSRLERVVSGSTKVAVLCGQAAEDKRGPNGGFAFDIDCIAENLSLPGEWQSFEPTLVNLHNHAWQIFSAHMTPKLHAFLSEGGDK